MANSKPAAYADPYTPQGKLRTDRPLHYKIIGACGLIDTIAVFLTPLGDWYPLAWLARGMAAVTIVLCASAVVGSLVCRSGRSFRCSLAGFCLLPSIALPAYHAACERDAAEQQWRTCFRMWVADPMPLSVKKMPIESPPLSNPANHSWLRFRIARADFERIVQGRGFVRVSSDHLKATAYPWGDEGAPRLGEGDEFFEAVTGPFAYAVVIRTNSTHTEGIARYR